MNETVPKLTIIPANPELAEKKSIRRQLRVAAYCRVSTDSEEQMTSYEAQKTYYTDKIMQNPQWSMAGIFADEGITGTSAEKRPEFLRMIRLCRKRKIDLVLVKSISRFARNTVDCLHYIRALKELGIAVIFEKENINTLDSEGEMLITLLGAFAQAESESISQNVRWGIRQAMREGRISLRCKQLYGFTEDENGQPQALPDEAEVVRRIYKSFLRGQSIRMIKGWLDAEGIAPRKGKEWSLSSVENILKNEKYCGDVLLQKTFISDCISRKVIKNVGQLPMYLIENHHEGIVSRETYQAVQAEFARRGSRRSPNKRAAATGLSSYTSRYALSDRLVCGECGTLYRRCTWVRKGGKKIVWRCSSRLDYGSRYCKHSPTMEEGALQRAIMAAVNSMMEDKTRLVAAISDAIRSGLAPDATGSLTPAVIDKELTRLDQEFQELLQYAAENGGYMDYAEKFKAISEQMGDLREQKALILEAQQADLAVNGRIQQAEELLNSASPEITEWDEELIRQAAETVKVLSDHEILVCLRGGIEIRQEVI
ncbi:recombinase family protein [Angelakisella massiliensis]|uniref:recombinase family protein n=1 Tax=Angelakisella massiliensis TaxID=1871018 RepID=UPI0008F86BAE|nr:recombinase family protein [Angelakisella massiliensis]